MKSFLELRRLLPLLAGVLFLLVLAFPVWNVTVHAIQYPNEPLRLDVYAYPRIEGDYEEMHMLNKYIGFYYPDPVYWTPNYKVYEPGIDVPEWSIGWVAFLIVSGLSIFVAVAPNENKLKKGLFWQLVGTISVFTVMLVDIQYRLYQAGHTLDPNAPVLGVDDFTPPVWGKYEVANITSYSRFGTGVYLATVAILLLAVAFWYRNSTKSLGELGQDLMFWSSTSSARSDGSTSSSSINP